MHLQVRRSTAEGIRIDGRSPDSVSEGCDFTESRTPSLYIVRGLIQHPVLDREVGHGSADGGQGAIVQRGAQLTQGVVNAGFHRPCRHAECRGRLRDRLVQQVHVHQRLAVRR